MMLEDLILDYVRRNPDITFAELVRVGQEAGFDMLGSYEIWAPADPNVVFWGNMSLEFAKAIGTLRASGKIHLNPASPIAYLADGCPLPLPLASDPPPGGYTTLHWLPVFISSQSLFDE